MVDHNIFFHVTQLAGIIVRAANVIAVPALRHGITGDTPVGEQRGLIKYFNVLEFLCSDVYKRQEDTNDDGILEKDGTSLAIHFNYSQSLASVDNAVLSIAASLKELGFDVTIDAVDMNTWYGALMAGEYDLTFYNTAGGSFDLSLIHIFVDFNHDSAPFVKAQERE